MFYVTLNFAKFSKSLQYNKVIIQMDEFKVKTKTNLIDVFVCFDKVNGELPQGS